MKNKRLTIDNKDLYRRYQGIKKRCYNKKYIGYKNYGERGIKVAKIWLGKDGFYNFLIWALNNGYKKELQIDRINNDGDYSPNNCRWVDRKTNMHNRRNSIIINGKTLKEISIELNIKYDTLQNRYKKYGAIEIPKVKCQECHQYFKPYRINQKFCSNKCRKRNSRRVKF